MTKTRHPKSAHKIKRLHQHLVRCPWDKCARKALASVTHPYLVPAETVSPSMQRIRDGVTLTALKRAA